VEQRPPGLRFEPCAEILLSTEALGADRFPLDREMTLMVLLVWVLWPDGDEQQRVAARFSAGQVTFRKRLSNGEFDQGVNNDLTSLSHLFEENWYRQFYSLFFQPIGGLASLLSNYEIRAFAECPRRC
jgi:hypothetical protein